MTSPYDIAMRYFTDLSLAHHIKVMPFLAGSVGNHLFHLMNRKKKILWKHGSLLDARMHVFFVAPSRVSKSTFFKKWCEPINGLLSWEPKDPDKAIENIAMLGSFTEAGFIGTNKESETLEGNYGLAYWYRKGIVTFEEMSSILLGTAQQEHSKTLIPQLLMALDGGDVAKHIGKIAIQYHTDVTVWAGTQFARFDLAQGLAGRFSLVCWPPTPQDYDDIYEAYMAGRNRPAEPGTIIAFRRAVSEIKRRIDNELIHVDFGRFSLRDHVKYARHWEQEIAEKMILGLKIIKNEFEPHGQGLKITLDPSDEELALIKSAWSMRESLMEYGPALVLLSFLPSDRDSLLKQMIKSGYTVKQIEDMIRELITTKEIISERKDNKLWLRKR